MASPLQVHPFTAILQIVDLGPLNSFPLPIWYYIKWTVPETQWSGKEVPAGFWFCSFNLQTVFKAISAFHICSGTRRPAASRFIRTGGFSKTGSSSAHDQQHSDSSPTQWAVAIFSSACSRYIHQWQTKETIPHNSSLVNNRDSWGGWITEQPTPAWTTTLRVPQNCTPGAACITCRQLG